ncbi:MAG: hypothetical protein E7300_00870 [Lachnospiraceae bacterium]|nr:hypothetical protein [Lachnospiraceae bacterium]
MDKVNIYLHTTIHGPRKQNGVGGYILECERYPHPATLTNFVELENESEGGAEVTLLAAALKRIKKPCALSIYTDSQYIATAILAGWLDHWQQNGFKNAKGEQIPLTEKWQEIAERLNASELREVYLKQQHSYRVYLDHEVKRRKNEPSIYSRRVM